MEKLRSIMEWSMMVWPQATTSFLWQMFLLCVCLSFYFLSCHCFSVFVSNLWCFCSSLFCSKFFLFVSLYPWSSLVEGGEGLYLPNCQTILVIASCTLSLLFCKFTNTTAYHLGRYEPSSPISCHAPRSIFLLYRCLCVFVSLVTNVWCFCSSLFCSKCLLHLLRKVFIIVSQSVSLLSLFLFLSVFLIIYNLSISSSLSVFMLVYHFSLFIFPSILLFYFFFSRLLNFGSFRLCKSKKLKQTLHWNFISKKSKKHQKTFDFIFLINHCP